MATFQIPQKKEGNECKIPSFLFKAQIDAKITHLEQLDKKLPTHEAMGKFYEEVGDLIDDFVETYKAIYPLSIKTEGSSVITNHVKYFQDLYTAIDVERKHIKESFLQNQIDNMQQLITHTIYRLKFITD